MTLAPLVVASAGCADLAPERDEVEEEEELAEATSALTVSGGNARWYNTGSYQSAQALKDLLASLSGSDTDIQSMASSAEGGWVVLTAAGYHSAGPLPSGMSFWLSWMKSQGETLRAVAIAPSGGWVIVGHTQYRSGGAVPQAAKDKISQYLDNGWVIRDVELTDTGYVVLGAGATASYADVDSDLMSFLADRLRSKRQVQDVAIGPSGAWVAVAGQEPASEGITAQLGSVLSSAAAGGAHLSKLMLGPGSSFVVYSHGKAAASPNNAAEAIEYGVPGGSNLWQRMSALGVPGVSIAIIDDNQVQFARGYGVLEQGKSKHVLASTPFDMASLSKFVGALAMTKLDADSRFGFDLDDSIVDTRAPGGMIDDWLDEAGPSYGMSSSSMSSALSVANFLRHKTDFVPSGGSPSFAFGTNALDSRTTLDLLLGFDCFGGCGYNGNNFAWTAGGAGVVPSSYDSVNFLVPQAVLEDVTGESAAAMLEEYFFSPMGLSDISGRIDSPILARAAWQHSTSGPVAQRRVYPWTFAGGIYASPSDYAELMILALNEGKDSSGAQRVPAAGVTRMLSVQDGRAGFGLFSESVGAVTENNDNAFRHSGAHGGQARTFMCGNPTRDQGIVIAFNMDVPDGRDNDVTNETIELRNYILDQYVSVVGWPGNCR